MTFKFVLNFDFFIILNIHQAFSTRKTKLRIVGIFFLNSQPSELLMKQSFGLVFFPNKQLKVSKINDAVNECTLLQTMVTHSHR